MDTEDRFADFTAVQLRNWLRDRVDVGTHCPTCTQMAKVYRRRINSGMAISLIKMYREAGTDWCHVPTVVGGRSREEGKLRYWGLVEEEIEKKRDDGGRAGYWRVTDLGALFVQGTLALPKYARIYDGRCLSLDTTQTATIHDALGANFDLRELMSA